MFHASFTVLGTGEYREEQYKVPILMDLYYRKKDREKNQPNKYIISSKIYNFK